MHSTASVCLPFAWNCFPAYPPLWLQVLDYAIESDQLIEKYETLASELLQWIEQTILTLNDRQLANSLNGVQNQLQAFNSYRTVEKPPKWVTAIREYRKLYFKEIYRSKHFSLEVTFLFFHKIQSPPTAWHLIECKMWKWIEQRCGVCHVCPSQIYRERKLGGSALHYPEQDESKQPESLHAKGRQTNLWHQ